MKKGQSYITITSENNPKDKMIIALQNKGYRYIEIIYASMYATDAGWTMVHSNKGVFWLGYTRKSAMEIIKLL